MALSDEEQSKIAAAVATAVVRDLKATASNVVVAVERTAPAAPEPKKLDPYRPALQFLTGLLAFCLALIVALFAALGADKGHAINALVSQVLMAMAITAVVGTVAIGLMQLAKTLSPDKLNWLGGFSAVVALVAVVCGGRAVVQLITGATTIAERYCVAKPAEGISETALNQFWKGQSAETRDYARAYASARASDCLAAGDLASSAAWARISGTLSP